MPLAASAQAKTAKTKTPPPIEIPGEVVWSPHPGSQSLFLSCPYFEALYEGTRGPGKTDCLLMDFAQHVGQGFGAEWRGILFRRTYKQLSDLIAKSRKWFRHIFPDANFNASDHTWSWPDGEELLLRYMNRPEDYWNYHGHEYPWIGWEELTSWPDLKCYHMMKSCSRATNPDMPRKYRATCNPYGRGHNAVKAYFIDPAPPGVPFIPQPLDLPDGLSVEDSGAALKAVRIAGHYTENLTLLDSDPDYPRKIAAAAENPQQAKAWLDGDWDIQAGGMVDDVWDRAVHILEPFEIPPGWRVDRSFDWGSSRPFSVGWWAESDGTEATMKDGTVRNFPPGTLFRIAEWYGWNGQPNEGCRMLAVEIARGTKEREKVFDWGRRVRGGPADSSIYDVENGKCIADDMEQVGVKWVRADKSPGSRRAGAEEVRKRLKAGLQHPMEDPGLFVFETCRHWLRTVPTIPRSDKDPDDVDTESEDHAWDETRYRCRFEVKKGYNLRLR